MKRPAGRTLWGITMLFAVAAAAMFASCGGGGSSSGAGGTAGPATVNVSLGSAPSFPAGTVFAETASGVSAAVDAAAGNGPAFDNVFVTVTRLALIPAGGGGRPDAEGEMEAPNEPGEEGRAGKPGFVTVVLDEPLVIDLLHPPTEGEIAGDILGRFPEVPAGEYSKIRVYYDNVVGRVEGQPDTLFHPTAHYHFDVHFVGGNLAVPVATAADGGIRFYSVAIELVGLKYHQAGNGGNVLLRPQVFARVVGDPKYIVRGVAEAVDPQAGTFRVVTAGDDEVAVVHGAATEWFFVDGWRIGPFGAAGAGALRDTAIVEAVGTFQGGVLVAGEVDLTFPDAAEGPADNVWILPDNVAFIVQADLDNVVVFPEPGRASAYYDDGAAPHPRLDDTFVANGVRTLARGYFVDGVLEAYWITLE